MSEARVGFYLLPKDLEAGPSLPPRLLRPRLSVIREVSEESSRTSTPSLSPSRRLSTQSSQSTIVRKASSQQSSQSGAHRQVSTQQSSQSGAPRQVSTQQSSQSGARQVSTQQAYPTGASKAPSQPPSSQIELLRRSQHRPGQGNQQHSVSPSTRSTVEDLWRYEEATDSLLDKENRFQAFGRPARRRERQPVAFMLEDEAIRRLLVTEHNSQVTLEKTTSQRGRRTVDRRLDQGLDSSRDLASSGGRQVKTKISDTFADDRGRMAAGRPSRVQFNSTVTVQSLPPVHQQPAPHRKQSPAYAVMASL